MGKENESIEQNELKQKVKDAKIVRRVVLVLLAVFILTFIFIGTFGYFYVKSGIGPVAEDSEEEIEIEIPLGSSTADIAAILKENGLIKNSTLFRFYIKFKNYADFQAGDYTLSPAMSLNEILDELQHGKVMEEPLFRVTIPEGKTVEQIAMIFSKQMKFSEDEFVEKARDQSFIEQMVDKYPNLLSKEVLNDDLYMPLEGYLFASTYDIYDEDLTAHDVIEMMIERTNDVLEKKMELIDASDYTIHEILTLASVIEREAKFPEDRPKVAQVYFNRLENGMKLQSDITAFYGLKNLEHKAVVTYDDLEVSTPYNTYKIDGLPIGPIDSPSEDSIDAVLAPEGKDFTKLYYFSRPNGETFYADTLEEHEQIKEEYRHEWYELENETEEQ